MAKVVRKIVNVVKKVVKKVVEVVKKVVKAVVNFVGDVIGAVIGGFIPTIGGTGPGGSGVTDMPSVDIPGTTSPEAEAVGVTLTKQGSNIPIPIIYGFRRVGAVNVFLESNGDTNKYLYAVYVIGEGPIRGVKRILVDDIEIPLPTESDGVYNAGQEYTVTSGRFANRMKFQLFYGTDNQPQSSLANASKTWGQKQRRGPNIAYAAFRFEWTKITSQEEADANPYRGGMPMVKFDVLGRLVRDCRNIPVGGSISSVSSTSYSFNPANIIADYMTNTLFGCAIPDNKLDGDSFRIAANKYEQTVTYSDGVTGRSHTLNIVASPSGANFETLKSLIANSRCALPYSQGKYKLKVEDGGHPTDIQSSVVTSAFDVTKQHYMGSMELEGEKKDRKYNQVRVNFVDPDKEWSSQSVIYTEPGDLSVDNNEPLIGEFQYPGITNKHIALDIARMIYRKSRVGRQLMFNATQELLNVDIGDIITITNDILDLDADTFRVMAMRLDPEGTVTIEASEHDASLYPYVKQAQVVLPAPIFKTDVITLEPLVRTPPEFPVGVFPPNDPDAGWTPGDVDSAGELVSPPINTLLPPITDPDNFFQEGRSVRYFEVYTGQFNGETWIRFHNTNGGREFNETLGGILTGSNGEGLLHNWREYGSILTGGSYSIPNITPSSTFVTTTTEGVDIFDHNVGLDYGRILNNAVTIGGVSYNAIAFLPNRPRYDISDAQIEYYQNGSLVYQTNWHLREILNQPALKTYLNPPADRIYGAREFLMPLIPNTNIRFRWIRDWTEEMVDGSYLARSYSYYGDTLLGFKENTNLGVFARATDGFYDGGYINRYNTVPLEYAYKLPDGTTTAPRSNIEALMNYYNDMATRSLPGSGGSSSTSFSQPLG